jgi:hypothetical protein
MMSVPCGRVLVMHDAVDGAPGLTVTGVVPQPVFALQATVPLTAFEYAPSFTFLTKPYCPEIVAVNVTD